MRLLPKPTGLWRNTDFVKLWAGQTISTFGTLMGALQLTAVLVLDASPFQMGLLAALRVAPGLIFGPMMPESASLSAAMLTGKSDRW